MNKITLEVYFPEKRQMDMFVNMLAWMEYCGNVGHCTDFLVRLDGDGSARPKFVFENEKTQESFNDLKRDAKKIFHKTPMYKDDIDLHFSID